MKVVVFDLGGTLMQYAGMPQSWVDFYYEGFEAIIQKFKFQISPAVVEKSFEMLKEFNPRINNREIEYSAEYIFTKVLEPWHINISIQSCLETFWRGLQMISKKFATPMTELIFVGDEEKDRKTALNANCNFVWIQRIEKNEQSIESLYELL